MTQYYLALMAAPHLAPQLRRANEERAAAFAGAVRPARRLVRAVGEALAGLAERYRREARLREAEAELHAFSDRALADIGLTRGEIAHAVRHGRPERPGPSAAVVPFGARPARLPRPESGAARDAA